ncbi:type II toxin-antitoxin system YafQ family toxin [Patescibacteria group bacterium]
MNIRYSSNFKKQYKKLSKNVKKKFGERIKILLKNPRSSSLRIHKLSGKLQNSWSMNITGDIRAVFDHDKNNIFFITIGTHSELYK